MKQLRATVLQSSAFVVLFAAACGRTPPGTGEGPAASATTVDPMVARKKEMNLVIPCCRALQELWAQRGGPFVRTTQMCTGSFPDIESGRRTAPEIFRQVAESIPAGDLPAACK